MFVLLTKTGKLALMRNGEPFIYSSRALADLGKSILTEHRKEPLRVKEFA